MIMPKKSRTLKFLLIWFLVPCVIIIFTVPFIQNWCNGSSILDYMFLMISKKDCFCGGERMCFENKELTHVGLKFDCALVDYLKYFGLFQSLANNTVSSLNPDKNNLWKEWKPVIVTAASQNHFGEARRLVHSLHTNATDAKIIFYDLGLNFQSAEEVKQWCNVEYIKFSFDKYPAHISNLLNYGWKVLLIAEQLHRHSSFFYTDSSITLSDNSSLAIFPQFVRKQLFDSYMLFVKTGHSIYATTYPGLSLYFPISEKKSKNTEMFGAAPQYIVEHSHSREVLKWAVLCTLTQKCIDPPDARVACNFGAERYKTYAGCHRYDQSLVNMIANGLRPRKDSEENIYSSFGDPQYLELLNKMFQIEKTKSYTGKLKRCR